MQSEYLSTSEAAKLIGANLQTVQRWIREKTLKARKKKHGLTFQYQIKTSDVLELMKQKGIPLPELKTE